MAAALATQQIETIGTVAGMVWHYLNDNGPVPLSRLARDIDAPRDLVMQAVGWLAREGNVRFVEGRRTRLLALS